MFSKNKLFSTTGITIGLIISLIFGVGANADNSINENVNVKTELDLACVAAAKEAGVDTYSKDCIVSYSVKEVETKSISPLDILLEKGLTNSQKSEMLAVNATAAISSKTVTINTNGITYQVDMTVKYYYNGSRVWVTQAYSGYTGYQTCFVKYSTAPNWITITGCSDTGGVTTRTLRADWDNMQYNLYTYHRYMILKPKSDGTYTTAFG